MDNPIFTIPPIRTEFNFFIYISLAAIVLSLIFLFYNQKRKVQYYEKNRQQLYSLLAMFVVLLGLSTAVVSFMFSRNVMAVNFYKDGIEVNDKKIPFAKIDNSYLYMEREGSMLNQQAIIDSTLVLIIELKNGDREFLTEHTHEIKDIQSRLVEKIK